MGRALLTINEPPSLERWDLVIFDFDDLLRCFITLCGSLFVLTLLSFNTMPRPHGILPLPEDLYRLQYPFAVFESAPSPKTIGDLPKEMFFNVLAYLPSSDLISFSQTCKTIRDHVEEFSKCRPWVQTHYASMVSAGIPSKDEDDPHVYDLIRHAKRCTFYSGIKTYEDPVLKINVSSCQRNITVLLADFSLHVYTVDRERMYSLDRIIVRVPAWHHPVPNIFYFRHIRSLAISPAPDRLMRGQEHSFIVGDCGRYFLKLDQFLWRPESYRFCSFQHKSHYFVGVREVGEFMWRQIYRFCFHEEMTPDNALDILSRVNVWILGSSFDVRVTNDGLFDMSSPSSGVFAVHVVTHGSDDRIPLFTFDHQGNACLSLFPFGPSHSFVHRRHYPLGFIGATSRRFTPSGGIIHADEEGLPIIGPFGPPVIPRRCSPFRRGRWLHAIVGGYIVANADNLHQVELSVCLSRVQAHLWTYRTTPTVDRARRWLRRPIDTNGDITDSLFSLSESDRGSDTDTD